MNQSINSPDFIYVVDFCFQWLLQRWSRQLPLK